MIIDNNNCTNCAEKAPIHTISGFVGKTHDEVPLCEECHNAISNDISCAN